MLRRDSLRLNASVPDRAIPLFHRRAWKAQASHRVVADDTACWRGVVRELAAGGDHEGVGSGLSRHR